MNPRLKKLNPYPFERLNALKAGLEPGSQTPHVPLSIGEPKHNPPEFVIDMLADPQMLQTTLKGYPATRGTDSLRDAISLWLARRFGIRADAQTNILPVAGTREALFSFGQAVVGTKTDPIVISPNPFYQIYEGSALLAGANCVFADTATDNDFQPDFEAIPDRVWKHTELVYLCSPGNPTGRVVAPDIQRWLIEQAHRYDFVIAADECYSEIYPNEDRPVPGLLAISDQMGNPDFARCVVFHSLSKRSNLPGLRSGFVAGDASVLARYYDYRTYQGCALGLHTQLVSEAAWRDETHVVANRALYAEKFSAVVPVLKDVLDFPESDGGFYIWAATPTDDETYTRALYEDLNITVLPGSYLSRDNMGANPGAGRVRIALVAPLADCVEAAERIRAWQPARF
jgi:N-succinyldiaminopimelate aminotransferase